MKLIGSLIIGIILPLLSFGITEYNPEDKLFVWAESGLNLRESPNSKSKILTKLSFGQEVICQGRKTWYEYLTNSKKITDNIELSKVKSIKIELKGNWVEVKFDNYVGFVFDCYLSKFQPIPLRSGEPMSLFEFFKKSCNSLHYLEKKDTTLEYGRDKIVFSNGIFMTENYSAGGSWFQINLPDFSKEEALMIIRYLNKHLPEIIQDKNGKIHIGDDMGEFTIEHFNNIVIISGEWSC